MVIFGHAVVIIGQNGHHSPRCTNKVILSYAMVITLSPRTQVILTHRDTVLWWRPSSCCWCCCCCCCCGLVLVAPGVEGNWVQVWLQSVYILQPLSCADTSASDPVTQTGPARPAAVTVTQRTIWGSSSWITDRGGRKTHRDDTGLITCTQAAIAVVQSGIFCYKPEFLLSSECSPNMA